MARFLLRFMSFLVDLCLQIPVICRMLAGAKGFSGKGKLSAELAREEPRV